MTPPPRALAVWHVFRAARHNGHGEAVAFAMAMRHLLDLDPALSAADAYAWVAEVVEGDDLSASGSHYDEQRALSPLPQRGEGPGVGGARRRDI